LIDQHPAGTQIPFTPKDAFEDMAKYDWSRVRVKLVMSIPGTYSGADKMDDFGICRIGKVLSEENWRPQSDEVVKAEYQVGQMPSELCESMLKIAGIISWLLHHRLV
jgi:tyrosyl-DNA phosphodiesterase-1